MYMREREKKMVLLKIYEDIYLPSEKKVDFFRKIGCFASSWFSLELGFLEMDWSSLE